MKVESSGRNRIENLYDKSGMGRGQRGMEEVVMAVKRTRIALLLTMILTLFSSLCPAQEEAQLTVEQKRIFLLNAKVIGSKASGVGVTNTHKLTLSDGKITHDASFQSIDEHKDFKRLDRGNEHNFVDSYLFNLAAYELAKLLELDDMLPVTVQRNWEGKTGSLTWWLPVQMSEGQRQKKKLHAPDMEAWNKSMHKVRVFTELIYDTDRSNPGNILIGHNWELYMIDFSRAFRQYHDLKNPKNLERCSRSLLEKLRSLDSRILVEKCGKYLNKSEIEGVMKRRDKILAIFDKLVAEKGEKEILY
jgi:hypothetical protein